MTITEIICHFILLVAASLYLWRGYYYTKAYFINKYNVKLSFNKIFGMMLVLGIDYRLLFCLPILKDNGMNKEVIKKSNAALFVIYVSLVLVFLIANKII